MPEDTAVPDGAERLLQLPSASYATAAQSAVYRLSELMFGSLLATYALGFIGAVAAVDSTKQHELPIEAIVRLLPTSASWLPSETFLLSAAATVFRSLDFLLISLCFSYLTAALYIGYHSGLLTMPQIPLKRLRWDFAIALSQAACFGVSMLVPALFPFLVSLALLVALIRQWYEVRKLEDHLAHLYQSVNDSSKPRSKQNPRMIEEYEEDIKETVRSRLREFEGLPRKAGYALAVWSRPKDRAWAGTLVLMLVGVGILFLDPSSRWAAINGALNILVSVALIKVSARMLGQRGGLLSPGAEADSMMQDLDIQCSQLEAYVFGVGKVQE
jgi:hypothetical protein